MKKAVIKRKKRKEHMSLLAWLGACAPAMRWATDKESLAQVWAECYRPGWMMWLMQEQIYKAVDHITVDSGRIHTRSCSLGALDQFSYEVGYSIFSSTVDTDACDLIRFHYPEHPKFLFNGKIVA